MKEEDSDDQISLKSNSADWTQEKKVRASLAFDPNIAMTQNQQRRYERRMNAKPRPRDIYDIAGKIQKRKWKQLMEKEM